MLLVQLISWQELEDNYASQFSANVGAPAKPVRLAFGFLYIKQPLRITDEETVSDSRKPWENTIFTILLPENPCGRHGSLGLG